MQALQAAREHSHHHSDVYAYWSSCINAKDYEEPAFEEEEEEDMFAAIEADIKTHLEAVAKTTRLSEEMQSLTNLSTKSSSCSSQESIISGTIITGGGKQGGDDDGKRCWKQDQLLLQPLQPFRSCPPEMREYCLDVSVVADVVAAADLQ
jgi:hypothetical protein